MIEDDFDAGSYSLSGYLSLALVYRGGAGGGAPPPMNLFIATEDDFLVEQEDGSFIYLEA